MLNINVKYRIHLAIMLLLVAVAGALLWKGLELVKDIILYKQENAPERHLDGLQYNLIQQNTLLPMANPVIIEPHTYATLIDCLVYYESKGDPNAVGDSGTSFGVLQFKEQTFQQYCVEKYGLENDIWNEDIQRTCCDEMLKSDFNNINHWSTKGFCLK